MKTLPLRCLAVVFVILLARRGVEAQTPIKEHTLWQRNLGSISSYQRAKQEGTENGESASVVFVDANTIAVTYRVQADSESRQAKNGVCFVDANSGTELDGLQWDTTGLSAIDQDFIRVLPTHDGEFLILVGRSILRFSASRKQLGERSIPDDRLSNWVLKIAPGGRLALLKQAVGPDAKDDHWISTDTLQDERVVPGPGYPPGYTLGKDFIVHNYIGKDLTKLEQLYIYTPNDGDQILCPECNGYVPAVIRDRIFFGGLPVGMGVVATSTGKILFRKKLGRKGQLIGQSSVAKDAPLIALYMSYLQVRFFRPMRGVSRIVVLNTEALQAIKQIDFYEPGEKHPGSLHFLAPSIALSPDGQKLAILWKSDVHNDVLQLIPLRTGSC